MAKRQVGLAVAEATDVYFLYILNNPPENSNLVYMDRLHAENALIRANELNTQADLDAKAKAFQEKIDSMKASIEAGEDKFTIDDVNDLEESAKRAAREVPVTVAQKQAEIVDATEERNRKLARYLNQQAKRDSKLGKLIRGARTVGGTLLIVDIAGRVYIWNKADRNPTLSPVATYSIHYLDKWFGSDIRDSEEPEIGFQSSSDYRKQYNDHKGKK